MNLRLFPIQTTLGFCDSVVLQNRALIFSCKAQQSTTFSHHVGLLLCYKSNQSHHFSHFNFFPAHLDHWESEELLLVVVFSLACCFGLKKSSPGFSIPFPLLSLSSEMQTPCPTAITSTGQVPWHSEGPVAAPAPLSWGCCCLQPSGSSGSGPGSSGMQAPARAGRRGSS